MRTLLYPERSEWKEIVQRPGTDESGLESTVRNIITAVRDNGDKALASFSEKFDGFAPASIKVTHEEFKEAVRFVSPVLKSAIKTARENITRFHSMQLAEEKPVTTSPGVTCWRKNVPLESAGLYIPGGSAPLFSTVLMLGIPAKTAGCEKIIICTPAGKDGKINPLILYTANILGITEIYKAGGAQAIAAMAFGTETIPRVCKIFGPGNRYVTKAKELLQAEGTAIDMPAGPSEVLVIGDNTADPSFIVADLLSQAEHGPDSQVIMLTWDKELIENVKSEIERQVKLLPRADIAVKSLENSRLVLLSSPAECIELSNMYAPEHLIINTTDPHSIAKSVKNAGSVFIGPYSCESAGDYATGTNHTLPTNGFAKSYSGVSTESFMKKISFQEVTAEGLRNLGPVIAAMAEAELLQAHSNAVNIRLNNPL